MDNSLTALHVASGSDAPAVTAFLEAFTTSTTTQPNADLQMLFISAVVECLGPPQVVGFLKRLDYELTMTGRFDDAQHAQWRWLLGELRLMQELDTKRFDAHVVAALERVAQRIESGNDPDVEVTIRTTDEEEGSSAAIADGASEVSTKSWDTIAKAMRESSYQTLRRLASGGSGVGSRDSMSSTDLLADGSESGTFRRSRQLQRQSQRSADANGLPMLQRNSSAVSDSVPMLLWSISSMMGLTMEETFLCQICYEHVPILDGVRLAVCGHRFCRACMKSYLELKIVDGQIYPLCFHETEQRIATTEEQEQQGPGHKACGAPIAPCDIESLVSPTAWTKYLVFKFNKENEYGRQCPYCDASQLCAGPEHPACVCSACAKSFCFTHGKAHADGTCADFELKQAEQDKMNRSAIAEISKPCPGCKSNVEKSGGCNHMKCVVCSTDFCWICGAVVDSNIAPMHFQWWNVRGCAGQQMEEVETQTPSERFWMNALRIAIVVFLGPPALVITLVLTLASCCCVPCVAGLQLTFSDCFTTCLNFVVVSLVLVITGIGIAVAFLCGLLLDIVSYPVTRIRSRAQARSHAPPPPPAAHAHASDQVSAA